LKKAGASLPPIIERKGYVSEIFTARTEKRMKTSSRSKKESASGGGGGGTKGELGERSKGSGGGYPSIKTLGRRSKTITVQWEKGGEGAWRGGGVGRGVVGGPHSSKKKKKNRKTGGESGR